MFTTTIRAFAGSNRLGYIIRRKLIPGFCGLELSKGHLLAFLVHVDFEKV